MTADRPDESESPLTVPVNSLQVETGFLYENFKENNLSVDDFSIAGTLLRYGLFENIELRFGAAYLVNNAEVINTGFGDFLFGAKFNFLTEEKNVFDFGLLFQAALPVGDENFNPQKTEPQIIAALSKSLSDKFSISVNAAGSWDSSIEKLTYLYAASLEYSITNEMESFIEIYGDLEPAISPEHSFDAGLTYLLAENIQVDISFGKGISEDSYWFIGTGVSFRINGL